MEEKNNYNQYYPTYHYKNRDIVLKEFENAQKIANSQDRLFGQLSSLFLGLFTIVITLFFSDNFAQTRALFMNQATSVGIISVFFGYLLIEYFIDLWKTIIINKRKVVVLRTILNLDYGKLRLVLPRWRVEGASNPFLIKLFPGWLNPATIPFWTIVVSINIVLYPFFLYLSNYLEFLNLDWYYFSAVIIMFFSYQFRKKLLDTHETIGLGLIKFISSILKLQLVENFEYIIYRARLAFYELQRLEIQLSNVKEILIKIEDQRFREHGGIDFKALLRGFVSHFNWFRSKKRYMRNGGSTITMQLARTLFIKATDYNKNLRRKLIEILLSRFWLEKQFNKENLLGIYLSAVRFENGINGIKKASDYFFEQHNKKSFSNEEAFFLIERLSVINSSYRENRIKFLLKRIENNTTNKINLNKENLMILYRDIENLGKIKRI